MNPSIRVSPWSPCSGPLVRSSGYVTRFTVRKAFLDNYEIHQVGGQTILEYWIPAGDLAQLNAHHRHH